MAFVSYGSGPRQQYSFRTELRIPPKVTEPAPVPKLPVSNSISFPPTPIVNNCCYKHPRIPPTIFKEPDCAPEGSCACGGEVPVGTDPNLGESWCE